MKEDIEMIIESLSNELVMALMQDYGWDLRTALDQYYDSETYRRLCDIKTGFWYESSVYVYEFLKNEMETGICA